MCTKCNKETVMEVIFKIIQAEQPICSECLYKELIKIRRVSRSTFDINLSNRKLVRNNKWEFISNKYTQAENIIIDNSIVQEYD